MKRLLPSLLLLPAFAALSAGADALHGVLEVRVVHGPSNAPAAGAVVMISGGGPEQVERQQTANAVGRVRFERLPPSIYQLKAFLAGHVYRDDRVRGEVKIVRAGETTTVETTLHRKPVITGVVADPDGRPLPFARVRLLARSFSRRGPVMELRETTSADDLGVYRFALERPGRYWVSATATRPSYRYGGGDRPLSGGFAPNSPDLAGAQSINTAFDQPETRLDLSLPWAGDSGVAVVVRSGRTGEYCRGCSFSLLRVEGGERYLFADGRIGANQQPPRSYGVRLPGLHAGRYVLQIADRQSPLDVWTASSAFELAQGASEILQLKTGPPVTVAGRVESAGGSAAPSREGRAPNESLTHIRLVRMPDGLEPSPFGTQAAELQEDRRFKMEPAPEGIYEITAFVRGGGYISGIRRASPVESRA